MNLQFFIFYVLIYIVVHDNEMPLADDNICLKCAVGIAAILYIIFTFKPDLLPAGIWKNKKVRAAARKNNSLIEGLVGDPNVVPGPIVSYYRTLTKEQFGENHTVVGLHYTDWCGYCKLMKPIWYELKKELSGNPDYSALVMVENDEQAKPTPGITGYPTIVKYVGGKARIYDGRADKDQLRQFILGTEILTTYGSAW